MTFDVNKYQVRYLRDLSDEFDEDSKIFTANELNEIADNIERLAKQNAELIARLRFIRSIGVVLLALAIFFKL